MFEKQNGYKLLCFCQFLSDEKLEIAMTSLELKMVSCLSYHYSLKFLENHAFALAKFKDLLYGTSRTDCGLNC